MKTSSSRAGPELAGDPFECGFHRLGLLGGQHVLEHGHRRPQPPHADAHLMHGLGIAAAQSRLVGGKLEKARPGDDPEGASPIGIGAQRNRLRVDRAGFRPLDQLIAAFRFVLAGEVKRYRLVECARDSEQVAGLALFQFQFDFA